MTEVLLVHPSTRTASVLANTLAGSEHLGLAYLGASLQGQYTVEIVDCQSDPDGMTNILEIANSRPAVLGASPTSASIGQAIEISRAIREASPTTLQVWGGHLATGLGEKLLQEIPTVDGVAIGESERTFPNLVRSWRESGQVPESKGYLWQPHLKRSGRLSIDGRPWTKLFPLRTKPGSEYRTSGARILTSLGCPYDCSFCTTPGFSGRRVERRSVDSVLAEMVQLHQDYGVSRFWINDDIFLDGSRASKERASQIAEGVGTSLPNVKYRALCRADTLTNDEALLEKLIQSGLDTVYVGLESGSDQVLDEFSKRTTRELNLRALTTLKHRGVFVQPGFIMFSKASTFQTLYENISFLAEAGLLYRVMPITRTALAYPGSELWRLYELSFDVNRSNPFVRYPQFDVPGIGVLSKVMEAIENSFAETDRRMYQFAQAGQMSNEQYSRICESISLAMRKLICASEDGATYEELLRKASSDFTHYASLAPV